MTVIDFNQAMAKAKAAGSFDPLPDGEYELVCLEASAVMSSNNNPMIKTKWQVETGPHAGSKVWDQYVFSADNDNSLSFFFQHMRHFGLDETFFSSIPPGSGLEPVATALPGRRCRMQLGQRMWEGRPRNEVLRIMPPATPNPAAAGGVVAGVPAAAAPAVPTVAAPGNPVGVPAPAVPAPAPAVAPQVPQVPPATPPSVQQPAPPPVPPQPAPAPVAVPQVPAAQPAPAPQPAPVPQVAPPPPPQPVWDGTQWVMPQQAPPAAAPAPTTPEEPF